jgi:ankyrin repeat protein
MTPQQQANQHQPQVLLNHGANPQLRDLQHHTAIYHAAYGGDTAIVQLLLEAWGQQQVPAVQLLAAAKAAIIYSKPAAFARLAKHLRVLYPAELRGFVERGFIGSGPQAAAAGLFVIFNEWASDISSHDEQQTAIRRRDENVAKEETALQQLIVHLSGLARSQNDSAAD